MSRRRSNRSGSFRARKGEGSVYEIADGTFRAAITDDFGKRISRRAQTEEEAYAKLEQLKRNLEQHRLGNLPEQTVGQFFAEWLLGRQRLRPQSYERYRTRLGHAVDYLGHIQLEKLTPVDIQRCYTSLRQKERLADSTVRDIHTLVCMALNTAVKWRLIVSSPAEGVEAPRKEHKQVKPLQVHELVELFRATEDSRYHALWVLLGTTGMRIGEGLGLRWSDVDLDQGLVYIHHSVAWVEGQGIVLGPPKTKKSERVVPLSRRAKDALVKHRPLMLQIRMASPVWHEQDLVFPNLHGDLGHPGVAAKNLSRDLQRAGFEHRGTHVFRHTATTELVNDRESLSNLQKMLGHANEKLLMRVYSHVTDRMVRGVADHMDALLDAVEEHEIQKHGS